MSSSAPRARLGEVFEEARRLGFLGPEDPQNHIEHAAIFVAAAETEFGPAGPARFLDLGSGAGVPGLVLIERWPEARADLLDASERRTTFLRQAVERLGVRDRVTVHAGRAEEAGRDADLRETFDLVVARSFAAAPVTAELASPFVRVGGLVLVSEPPEPDPQRWSTEGLGEVGLEPAQPASEPGTAASSGPGLMRLRKATAVPDRYPRRTGVPGKRPLW